MALQPHDDPKITASFFGVRGLVTALLMRYVTPLIPPSFQAAQPKNRECIDRLKQRYWFIQNEPVPKQQKLCVSGVGML